MYILKIHMHVHVVTDVVHTGDAVFCTGFSRLEVPEQALGGIPLGLGLLKFIVI